MLEQPPLFDNPQITDTIWKWFEVNKDHKVFSVELGLGLTKPFYLRDFQSTLELLIGVQKCPS